MRYCEKCGPRCPIPDTSSHKICGICRKAAPSIRTAAALIGKAPSTLQRWKRTNPELYRAVMEYAEKKATQRMVCTEVEDLGEATHEELLEGARRSTQRLQQRAQLREALEEILHDTRSYDAKQIARAALKATEE